MLKKLLVATTISILLLGMMGLALIPKANAVVNPVVWVNEDTQTKGDWQHAVNSITGTYGACAHIFPGPPGATEIPIGGEEVPINSPAPWSTTDPNNLGGTPYAWEQDQVKGYQNFYIKYPTPSTQSPYWDEYVPNTSGPTVIDYAIIGTREYAGAPINAMIQYSAFEFGWTDGYSASRPLDPRPLLYTTTVMFDGVTSVSPGWRAATWDDGGERCQPVNGYMNFTLAFPLQGAYVLSLYAYDYETSSRYSEQYRIYDSTGTMLLASKGISGSTFDNGVYEQFLVTAPAGGLTIILQVYNDAGHVPYIFGQPYPADKTNNVVLSGIFVENVAVTQACGRTKGFWQQNAEKDLGLSNGNGIQVNLATYKNVLGTVQSTYGPLINDWLVSGNPSSPLGLKPWAISTSSPATPTDMKWAIHWLSYAQVNFNSGLGINSGSPNDVQTKARGQMLCLMLTASWNGFGGVMYNGHTVSWWITQAINAYNAGDFATAFNIASTLNNDALCGQIITPLPPVG